MATMAKKFVGGAIALIMATAMIPVLADFVDQAQSNAAVTSTQSTVIGLVLTIFVLGVAYAAYQYLVE